MSIVKVQKRFYLMIANVVEININTYMRRTSYIIIEYAHDNQNLI